MSIQIGVKLEGVEYTERLGAIQYDGIGGDVAFCENEIGTDEIVSVTYLSEDTAIITTVFGFIIYIKYLPEYGYWVYHREDGPAFSMPIDHDNMGVGFFIMGICCMIDEFPIDEDLKVIWKLKHEMIANYDNMPLYSA